MLVLTLDDDICWRGHVNTGTGGPANVLSLNVKHLFFGGICEGKKLSNAQEVSEKRIYTNNKRKA